MYTPVCAVHFTAAMQLLENNKLWRPHLSFNDFVDHTESFILYT